MNCKNCGSKLNDNAKVCKNCGAFIDDNSGYVLLTSDDRFDDYYSSPEKKKKAGGLKKIIVFILIVAIIGGGAYLYFDKLDPIIHKAPEVAFESGSGFIDGGDKVIFVTLDNNNIQYIHGVSLYDYDISNGKSENPVTTEYEYTKSIDSTFRAIFFYTENLNIKSDKNYNYYMEIKLGFNGDDRIYTYVQPVEFSGDIKGDVAETVFDHSMYGVSRSDV